MMDPVKIGPATAENAQAALATADEQGIDRNVIVVLDGDLAVPADLVEAFTAPAEAKPAPKKSTRKTATKE